MAAESLRSEFLCSLTGFVAPPRNVGATPRGTRRFYPAIGGSFEGPRLRGEVLPDGGDWLLLRPDGVLEQDVRITLKTDDGAFIYARYAGMRHGPPEVIARLAQGEMGRCERILFPGRPDVRDWSGTVRLAEQNPGCGRRREAPAK